MIVLLFFLTQKDKQHSFFSRNWKDSMMACHLKLMTQLFHWDSCINKVSIKNLSNI